MKANLHVLKHGGASGGEKKGKDPKVSSKNERLWAVTAEHLTWYHKEHFSPHLSAAWSEERFKKRGLRDRIFPAQIPLAYKHMK